MVVEDAVAEDVVAEGVEDDDTDEENMGEIHGLDWGSQGSIISTLINFSGNVLDIENLMCFWVLEETEKSISFIHKNLKKTISFFTYTCTQIILSK